MKPLVRGEETDLVEIPASWYLDDLPPMMFIKGSPNSHGFVNPRHIEEMWRDQFDWVYRETGLRRLHHHHPPRRVGRPQVLLMLERLIEHINAHDGVRWATFDEIADDFIARQPAAEVVRKALHDVRSLLQQRLRLGRTTCVRPNPARINRPVPQPHLSRHHGEDLPNGMDHRQQDRCQSDS